MSDIKSTTAGKLAEELVNRIHRAKEDIWESGVELGKALRRAEKAEARVEELTTENARLEQELVAAEMGKSPAEQEIKLLTTERATLEDEVRRLHGRVKSLTHNIDHQKTRIRDLTEERDNLRTENERLKCNQYAKVDVLPDMSESRRRQLATLREKVDRLRADLANIRTAVPRVIRPDEVRKGQTVAIQWAGDSWAIRSDISAELADAAHALMNPSKKIVLLADAPEDADEDDDFPCCRINQTGICEDVG